MKKINIEGMRIVNFEIEKGALNPKSVHCCGLKLKKIRGEFNCPKCKRRWRGLKR